MSMSMNSTSALKRKTTATTRVHRVYSLSWTRSSDGFRATSISHSICPTTCRHRWKQSLQNKRNVIPSRYILYITFQCDYSNLNKTYRFIGFSVKHDLGKLPGWESCWCRECRSNWVLSTTGLPGVLLSVWELRGLSESTGSRSFHSASPWVFILIYMVPLIYS